MKGKYLLVFIVFINAWMLNAQDIEIVEGQYYLTGKLFSGTYTEYYPDRMIKGTIEVKNGIEDGHAAFFFPNGDKSVLIYEMFYESGMRTGIWKIYNDDGSFKEERNYNISQVNG